MGWTKIQEATGSNGTAANNSPQVTVSATRAGSLLVAVFTRSGGSGSGNLTSVTDSAGNTWFNAAIGAVSGQTFTRIECWYTLQNVASGVVWVQGLSSTSQTWGWDITEWSGAVSISLDTASPVNSGTGAVSTCDTPQLATQGNSDLVIAGYQHAGVTTDTLNSASPWSAGGSPSISGSSTAGVAYNTGAAGGAGAPQTVFTGFPNAASAQVLGHTEPEVRKFGSTYYCYYRDDSTGHGRINLMTSTDGATWTEQGNLIDVTAAAWDSSYVISPSVAFDGTTYYLFYEGNNGSFSAIGYATATAPAGPFTKFASSPVLSKTGSGFESVLVGTPAVFYDSGSATFYLYYHGFDNSHDRVGLAWATSPSGTWTRHPSNPVLDVTAAAWMAGKVAPSSAIALDGMVYVFIEADPGTGKWAIGIAEVPFASAKTATLSLAANSTSAPVLSASASGWDNDYAQLPSVISDGTATGYWLYYSGHSTGGSFSLGRASGSFTPYTAEWLLGSAPQSGTFTVAFKGTVPAGGALDTALGSGSYVPGQPGGAGGPGGPPAPALGAGWEVRVLGAPDFHALLAVIPQKVLTGWQFAKQLKDLGSGSVTLDMDDSFWATTLPNGQPAHYLLDFEHVWQFFSDGVCRFEFLGETVTETLADQSEQRAATVTGPGTAATLKWAMAAPPGFPNAIRYKLDAISDSFSETDINGNLVLDTGLWNAASPASHLSLNPSGSCRLMASPGTTFLGSTAYDATNTLVSAQVTPIVSPDPAGVNLNGSQVTQMYVQSLANSNYYALIGMSGTVLYAQLQGPAGTFTKTIATAAAYNTAAAGTNTYAYWQISEANGTFFFWTSPDGQNWTKRFQVAHNWDATNCGLYFTAKYSSDNVEFATVTSINSNVSTSSLGGPVYFSEPIIGGVWLDLLKQAQARGTIPFITTGRLSLSTDSFGNPWTDSQSVQIANGTDLYALLGAHASMINADWVMQPGFLLQIGIPETGKVTLGTDRSGQVVFRDGQDCSARVRTRARQDVSNLLGVINSDGRTVTATDGTSAAAYGQREAWLQAAMQVTPADLDAVAEAADLQNATEVLSWTLQVSPWRPGRDIFNSYDVGDWIGLERPDFSAVDAVRIAAIAVQVAADGSETHELTLVSYIQWLQEQFAYIMNKLGGGLVSAAGTTAVSGSITNQNAPTVFSLTLGSLGDVAPGGPGGGAPLVYDPVTGQWTPAGSSNTITGSVPLSVSGPGGQVTIAGDGSAVTVAGLAAPPADAGTPVPVPTATHSPTGTVYADANGVTRVQLGQQSDGTVTVTEVNGPAPATPSTPVIAAAPAGVVVGWDGLLGGAAPLLDFLWTEVHVSTVSGFTPSSATLQATMAAGGIVTVGGLTPGTVYYARLVARNKSRVASAASAQASTTAQVAPSSSGQQAGVLDQNPFFYGGDLTGWAGANAAIAASSSPPAVSPTPYACLVTPSAQFGYVGSSFFKAVPAAQYLATAWVYTATAQTLAIGFNWDNASNALISNTEQATAVAAGTWTLLTTVQTSPALTASGSVYVKTNSASFSAYYVAEVLALPQVPGPLIQAGTITAAQIAAHTITAAQILAHTISATEIVAHTISSTEIVAGTITATEIHAGTITASLLAAGIVKAGIIDGTVVTGSTLQNSSSDPRTSINPDGSISITNSSGTVIFKVGPDGTIQWFNSVGVLLMELDPGGTTLIYASATGPATWDFEGSTNSWTGTNATLADDSAWSSTGADSLKITHSNTSQPWGATSPAFAVTANTLASMTCVLHAPSTTITGVTIGFTFFSGTGGGGTNLGSVTGDQGTFSVTSAADVVATITGATVPAGAQSAVFFVQSTLTTASVVLNIDSVSVAGGLVYSLSPAAGTDSLGNLFDQGVTFTGLPGLTNVLSVKDPYGNKLAGIDATGNVSGQVINAVTDLQVGGQSVSDLLDSAASGILNRGWTPTRGSAWPSTAIGTIDTALMELDQLIPAGRVCKILLTNTDFIPTSATQFVLNMWWTTDGTTPTTSSSNNRHRVQECPAAGQNYQTPPMELIVSPSSDTTYRVLISAHVQAGTFQLQDYMELRFEDLGDSTGSNFSNNAVLFGSGTSGGSGGTQQYTEDFYPLNTYSFYSASGRRNHNSSMFHGAYSGESDYQYSYIQWANGSRGNSISTALGFSVQKVTLRLTNQHSWYNNGMTWGLHTSPSGSLGGGVGTYSVLLGSFFIGEGNTFEYGLSSSQYSGLGGGNWTVLGPDAGDEHNLGWYGYFYGGGGSTAFMPRLRVTYVN